MQLDLTKKGALWNHAALMLPAKSNTNKNTQKWNKAIRLLSQDILYWTVLKVHLTSRKTANTPSSASILHTLGSIPICGYGSVSLYGVRSHLRSRVYSRWSAAQTVWMAQQHGCRLRVSSVRDAMFRAPP